MRSILYSFLSLWLSVTGALLCIISEIGIYLFKQTNRFGIIMINYSFKFDD